MSPVTVFTLGAIFTLMNAAEALITNSSTSPIASTHKASVSSSVTSRTSSTSSQHSSITTTATSATGSDNAAALLSTSYVTEWIGGEWNPYGNDPYGFPNNAPASINSYCSSLFISSSSHFTSTVGFTSSSFGAYTLTASATTVLVPEVVYVNIRAPFSYAPSAPCCLNCTLFGGTVQVYDWPTPAPSPPVTKLVNAANFTFVSPSVYVAFQSLHATDLCGQVGQSYNSTTLAFAPGALMTAPEYFIGTPYYTTGADNQTTMTTDTFVPPDESFTLADFGQDNGCTAITSVTKFSDSLFTFDPAMGGDGTMTITMTYNPCSPKVSMPTELFTINSMWTACLKGIDGLFDPPYTLTTGNGLSAFSSTTDPVTAPPQAQTTSAAVAGSTPAPVTPVQTTADPTPVAPASTPSPDPPASTPANDPTAETSTPVNDPPAQSPTAANDPPAQSPTPADDPPAQSPTTANDPPALSPTPANDPPAQSPTTANDPSPEPSSDPSIPVDPPTDPASTAAPSPVVIASQTLAPGSQITHSSTTYSLASNGATLIVANSQGTTTQILATSTPPSVVIASQTLAPGSQITHSSTTYSLASNGATLIIANSQGTTTQILATPALSPQSSFIVVGAQTISAGSSAVTISGTTYSLAPSGNAIVVDGTSQYLIGSQTLIPGGAPITISGTVASLLPDGSSVVVAGSTLALSAFTGTGVIGTTSEVGYLIGSQTLVPGGVATITVSGSAVQVSLLAGGSSIVVGGTTTMPASVLIGEGATSTEVLVTETGLGGIIASVGGFVSSSSTGLVTTSPNVIVPAAGTGTGAFNGTVFTGVGSSVKMTERRIWVIWWGLLLGFGTIGVVLL